MFKKQSLTIIAASLLVGCAHLTSTTSDPVIVQSGTNAPVVAMRTTRVSAYTFFDAQSALTKFQNRGQLTQSNQWPSGTSVGSLNQESQGSNVVNSFESIARGAAQGTAQGMK